MLQKFRKKFIGNREFYHTLMVLIIPMIVQQGISSFVNLLDNVMVGRLGTESMSGVAIVNQLIFVFNLAVFGGLSGASIYGAQFFGKGDIEGVRHTFRFKVIFSAIISVLAIAVLYFFQEPMISLFLSESESGGNLVLTLNESKNYLLVMLWGLFPFALSQAYASSLKETGETFSPMMASVLAILVNLVLNYILIFGSFGAPKLGVTGAAIATVISRYIEMFYLMIHTWLHRNRFTFIKDAFQSLYIPSDIVKNIFITGTPLILNEVLWSVGTTMINQSYSTRGLTVVAAINITNTVWNLFCIVMFAMGSAVSILIGQLLGAGKIEQAKDTDNKLLFFTLVLHIAIGGLIILTAPFVPLIYNTEQAVRELTTQLLVIAGIALPLHAFVHVTYFTIRSGGKTFVTFLFDCVYTWLIPFPVSYLLSRFTGYPVTIIYFCVQFVDILKVFIGVLLLRSGVWAKNIVNK